ncbi:30S ribosomal protein S7 [Candidatus Micrarchaeota archaeon CG10_big_fil_rev_8_21_14_0_10_54_18]|nr:MAG: 30S ribosomal protein S7 [Candidatus Micrarchaeota archaeon CG09_land_8_20_14_0_10_55_25]PJD01540.1 MAG: 30S ribosomal protein S7 [Candidatus Micrarchaeota archaeon CG10_big_fil_rev_8_21_14_0_10_54_18]
MDEEKVGENVKEEIGKQPEPAYVGPNPLLFGRYSFDVEVHDPSLRQVLCLKPVKLPHTFARHANKRFAKANVNVVERLANKLMRGGTGKKIGGKIIRTQGSLQGKKTKVVKILEKAFDEIHAKTRQNPVQLLVNALEYSAPNEDITRVRFGGVSYQQAVDIGTQRRLDLALRNLATAAIMSAFNNKMSLAGALAREIMLAAENNQDSYAVKRKNETERIARSAR